MANAQGAASVNFRANKKSHIAVIDPNKSMTSQTDVKSVVDTQAIPGKTITFGATKFGNTTPGKLKIRLEGQGLPPNTRPGPDAGSLTITLMDPSKTPPTVQDMPVDYVDDPN